jgi:hypothetical protein
LVVRHELVHVVESLLKGRFVGDVPPDLRVHVWFSEGLAEAVTDGTSGGAIRDLDYFNELTAFEMCMGITLEDCEERFFGLMNDYLD